MSVMSLDLHALRIVLAGAVFMVLFPGLSFLLNRYLCKGRLLFVRRDAILLMALVFGLALFFEATINPLYENLFGHKLWVYRLFPLHDGNVSALALLIWTSYGLHLYFLNQTLDRWFVAYARRNLFKAMLIGAEAPLLWEVLGNSFFILTVGEFYAYYLPGDLWHLTSLQVVPVYMLCIYTGLRVHGYLQTRVFDWKWTAGLFVAGSVFLGLG